MQPNNNTDLPIPFPMTEEDKISKNKEVVSRVNKAFHELICAIEEKEHENSKLREEIFLLQQTVKRFEPFTMSLADSMKMDLILEHWNDFTSLSLESFLHRHP